ncbi:MAG: hypothetical protein KA981_08810 [Bacteroidia bacterium]|jgi:hypothetical protein|nr:hypothetical protein [Bacteroidia bacterium]
MNKSSVYLPLWQKYRPAILSKMKLALVEPQEYPLYRHEFEAIGGKRTSGYGFNMEVNKGMMVNNIAAIAVARDLLAVLKASESGKAMIQQNYFKINLGSDYKLKIQVIVKKPVEVAPEEVAESI